MSSLKKEEIHHVTLCLDDYKGSDFYCDGDVEDQILEIVKTHDETDFDNIIETSANWPIMYHLSCVRENIMKWYPFKQGASILEIGAGCGAVSGALCEDGNHLTCIDLSKKRSMINAYRHKNESFIIRVGNFEDIHLEEKFDYVTLIGVLEYGGSYIHDIDPYTAFLKKAASYLKPNGKLLIAIENKLGLKYWSGCKEDHVGTLFEGIEGYPNTSSVRTFSKKELEGLLVKAGLSKYRFYYPYPDYKFAHTIFSDQHLPNCHDCNDNRRNFDMDRLELFDEGKVFDTLIENDLFPQFSNSFFVEAGAVEEQKVTYAKFSQSNRAREFQTKTTISLENGMRKVFKEALHPEGQPHINKMIGHNQALCHLYEHTNMDIVACSRQDDRLCFDYVQGSSLEERLVSLLQERNMKELVKQIEDYFYVLFASSYTGQMDPSYATIFTSMPSHTLQVMSYANIDAIFQNVKVQDGNYVMFDYEWVFAQPLPIDYIKYRSIFYFQQSYPIAKELNLFAYFEISEEAQRCYQKMEEDFQSYVRKGKLVDDQLHTQLGQITITKDELISLYEERRKLKTMQVFLDSGNGYTEAESMRIPFTIDSDYAKTEFAVNSETKKVRIDPMDTYGIVRVSKLYAYHAGLANCKDLSFTTNGKQIGKESYLFLTDDPVIELNDLSLANHQVVVEFELWPLKKEVACWIGKRCTSKKLLKGRF